MECARAFGACIMLRDEPASTPIPERFEPSKYHEEQIAQAVAEVARLKAMTPEEMRNALEAHRKRMIAERAEAQKKDAAVRARYEAMIEKVQAWNPPTSEHTEMKKFMLSQLRDSIEFDCHDKDGFLDRFYTIPDVSPETWNAHCIANANKDIEYHTKKHAEEVSRANDRTAWVKALRESLA